MAVVVAQNGSRDKIKKNMVAIPSNPYVSIAMSAKVKPLLADLDATLKKELQFHSKAQPVCNNFGLITCDMRDGSAHVLRCLKVWYDLPFEVFFNSLFSIDRFLDKMKAQPKHLSCISVSAFHLVCRRHHEFYDETVTVPEKTDLINISQSRCSPSDLLRMQAILSSRVEFLCSANLSKAPPVNAYTILCQLYNISKAVVPELLTFDTIPNHLLLELEIIVCDSISLSHRPAEIALALLAYEFQKIEGLTIENEKALTAIVNEFQKFCRIQPTVFNTCLRLVANQLDNYNSDGTVIHRQRLVWKLSNRTLRHLRPMDKLKPLLPSISESSSKLRSNSECSIESIQSSIYSEEDLHEEQE